MEKDISSKRKLKASKLAIIILNKADFKQQLEEKEGHCILIKGNPIKKI
jgi:hypothetical protein